MISAARFDEWTQADTDIVMAKAHPSNGKGVDWKSIAELLPRGHDGELRTNAMIRNRYFRVARNIKKKPRSTSAKKVKQEEVKPKEPKEALSIDDDADAASVPGSPSQSPTMGTAPTSESKWPLPTLVTLVDKRKNSLFGCIASAFSFGLDAEAAGESAPDAPDRPFFSLAPTMSVESNYPSIPDVSLSDVSQSY